MKTGTYCTDVMTPTLFMTSYRKSMVHTMKTLKLPKQSNRAHTGMAQKSALDDGRAIITHEKKGQACQSKRKAPRIQKN